MYIFFIYCYFHTSYHIRSDHVQLYYYISSYAFHMNFIHDSIHHFIIWILWIPPHAASHAFFQPWGANIQKGLWWFWVSVGSTPSKFPFKRRYLSSLQTKKFNEPAFFEPRHLRHQNCGLALPTPKLNSPQFQIFRVQIFWFWDKMGGVCDRQNSAVR